MAADLYPPNELFSVFAFLGFMACAIPLPWHLQAWNVGTCMYMFWVGAGCLNAFINSIVWNHNIIDWAPGWCDLSTRIIIAENVSIAICSLVINRRLYFIASSDTVTNSPTDKRRGMIFDILLCTVVPLVQVAIAYVVTANRYGVYENIGCVPAMIDSVPTLFLFQAWPLVIGLVSASYSIRTVLAFNRRRHQFKELLSSHSNLSGGRYIRLMVMAGTDVLCVVPLSLVMLVVNARNVGPWGSWDIVHLDYNRIDKFPAIFWHAFPLGAFLEVQRWYNPLAAFLFFALFGFAEESRKKYWKALSFVTTKIGVSSGKFWGSSMGSSSQGTMLNSAGNRVPVYLREPTSRSRPKRRDTLDSFTDISTTEKDRSFGPISTFGGDVSFGGVDFVDAGGALAEPASKEVEPTSPYLVAPAPAAVSPTSERRPSDALDIEISSLRRASTIPLHHSPDIV
ncbi:putative pheromone receptor [Cylindrobasidium torrendii FP15055 ss-10]|uniref:Putative pheromone receptor n=1 Tax=Cylindrobasidium torrendii FP15055 ss-10 TaxID=1314674 RepID=A0A0D7B508_9AGAR|nr:putative pheromone receptor [Cylindrobasidium torrendii FP15055 ss-10]